MSGTPTIRYSKGFNCLILEDSDHLFYFFPDEPRHYESLCNVLRRWADREPVLHAELDQKVQEREMLNRRDEYLASGGRVTVARGAKLRLEDFSDISL